MKKNKRAWLEGQSYHVIRNEMLGSHAWKAASHLQRSMVLALLTELGRHSGKDNGNLIFTNRNLRAFGISFDVIKPNLAAIKALGFYDYKGGRPGLRARRGRMTFMPILDADGKEIEPPTDEWARFNTTEEAKMAAETAYKRASSSKKRSDSRITSAVIQPSDHYAAKRNRKTSAEMPMDIGSAESEIGSLSISKKLTTSPLEPVLIATANERTMREYACVGIGKYEISKTRLRCRSTAAAHRSGSRCLGW